MPNNERQPIAGTPVPTCSAHMDLARALCFVSAMCAIVNAVGENAMWKAIAVLNALFCVWLALHVLRPNAGIERPMKPQKDV